jgi:hypothetical protein
MSVTRAAVVAVFLVAAVWVSVMVIKWPVPPIEWDMQCSLGVAVCLITLPFQLIDANSVNAVQVCDAYADVSGSAVNAMYVQPEAEATRHLLGTAQRKPTYEIYIVNACPEPKVQVYVSLYYMNTNGGWTQACEQPAPRGGGAQLATSAGTEFLWAARMAKVVTVYRKEGRNTVSEDQPRTRVVYESGTRVGGSEQCACNHKMCRSRVYGMFKRHVGPNMPKRVTIRCGCDRCST